MAVVPFKQFSNCFDQVQNACVAVKRGDANKAAIILRSLQDDAKVLHRECEKYSNRLQQFNSEKQREIEQLTARINSSYHQEQDLEKQKKTLKAEQNALAVRKQKEENSFNEAQRRYQQAERNRADAQDEYDTFKALWWVPILGQVLLIRELIEDYEGQARRAGNDMRYYQDRYREAQTEINRLGRRINEITNKICSVSTSIERLKGQRDELHRVRGDMRETVVFVQEATACWDDIASMSGDACSKSDRLQRVLNFAAKQNKVKILRSNGTKTLVGSFKDCWMEIAEMVESNNLVFAVEDMALGY